MIFFASSPMLIRRFWLSCWRRLCGLRLVEVEPPHEDALRPLDELAGLEGGGEFVLLLADLLLLLEPPHRDLDLRLEASTETGLMR